MRFRPASLAARTGAVGGTQQRGDIFIVCRDRHDADTDAKPEAAFVPHEFVLADGHAQRLRGLHGFVERAALQQDTKLVTAETRQRVTPADLRFQQRAELPE